MPSVEKIIEKMKNQPNGIRLQEADKVLMAIGYRLDRQKGSHRQYINTVGNVITNEFVGGHLNKAIVGATAEIVLNVVDVVVEREFVEEIGLNLFKF